MKNRITEYAKCDELSKIVDQVNDFWMPRALKITVSMKSACLKRELRRSDSRTTALLLLRRVHSFSKDSFGGLPYEDRLAQLLIEGRHG